MTSVSTGQRLPAADNRVDVSRIELHAVAAPASALSGDDAGAAAEKAVEHNVTLNEVVVVNENGGRKRISKRKAAFKQLVNEAAKGNWRALKLLVDILQDIERRSEPQTEENSVSLADEKVLAQLQARLRGELR